MPPSTTDRAVAGPATTARPTTRRALGRSLAALALLLPLAAFTPKENIFAPSAEVWPRWQAHDPQNAERIDFAVWDRLLMAYVTEGKGANLFDYASVTAADRQALDGFLASMAALPISLYSRPQQFAYWINLYNALTVQVVLDHFPVESIRDIDISPGWFSDGPWGKALIEVEGQTLSLDDIEHRILRPIWRDPRIHYAVNCASIGCPDLRPSAYQAEGIEAALDDAARNYVNDPRGVTVRDGRIIVSKIYDWFYEDFGRDPESLKAHLLRYAGPELAMKLEAIGEIHDTEYDWRLNAARPSG